MNKPAAEQPRRLRCAFVQRGGADRSGKTAAPSPAPRWCPPPEPAAQRRLPPPPPRYRHQSQATWPAGWADAARRRHADATAFAPPRAAGAPADNSPAPPRRARPKPP